MLYYAVAWLQSGETVLAGNLKAEDQIVTSTTPEDKNDTPAAPTGNTMLAPPPPPPILIGWGG